MTRNTNNSMRKMAVTGLTLIGMVLGGLGTVGCDRLSAEQVAQAFSSGGARLVRVATSDLGAKKSAAISRVINFGPPHR